MAVALDMDRSLSPSGELGAVLGRLAQRRDEIRRRRCHRGVDLGCKRRLDDLQTLADQLLSRSLLVQGGVARLGPAKLESGAGTTLAGKLHRLAGHLDALGVATPAPGPTEVLQALGAPGVLGLGGDQLVDGTCHRGGRLVVVQDWLSAIAEDPAVRVGDRPVRV